MTRVWYRKEQKVVGKRRILGSGASCLVIALASPALAQTQNTAGAQSSGLEEIVVVAQKRSENLQKVPIAITAIKAQTLTTEGIKSTQDLAIAVPGLQLLNVAGSLVPRVRGVGSTLSGAGIESPVSTYVDDVYHAFSADLQVDFADVDQVALLKGPQGTLFGRNATGGVLEITTRQPSFDFKGSFQTSLDNYLTTRSNVFVTGSLSSDVAGSLSVSYANQGIGYGTNLNTGEDIRRLDLDLSARSKLRAFIGDDIKIDFETDFSDRRGSTAAAFRVAPGYTGLLAAVPQPSSLWDVNDAINPYQSYEGGGLSLKVSDDLGFATLTSISAYRDGRIDYQFPAVPSPEKARNVFVDYGSSQFTEEIQLVSPSTDQFTWTVGLYYFHNDADIGFNTFLFGPLAKTFVFQSTPATQTVDSIAAFAQGTYKFTDTTRLTAGFRYTYDNKTYTGETFGTTPTGITATLASVENAPYSFEKPTWRFALEQDITPSVLAYATYNRGIKSGGFSTASPANPPFAPETLDAYEVGVKSQFLDGRVRANIDGFYYNYNNIQINAYTNLTPYVLNAATAENYGIDADLEAQVTDRLQLTLGIDQQHARFTSFPNAPSAIPQPTGGTLPIIKSATGNTLPNSPDLTYTLGATYNIPLEIGNIGLNVNDNFNTGFYSEPDNVFHQSSFHIVNASVTWTSSDEKYSGSLFVNNLLDKAVVSQMTTAPWGYIADYSNPPRVFGASFKVNF